MRREGSHEEEGSCGGVRREKRGGYHSEVEGVQDESFCLQLLQLQAAQTGATVNNSFGLGTPLGSSKLNLVGTHLCLYIHVLRIMWNPFHSVLGFHRLHLLFCVCVCVCICCFLFAFCVCCFHLLHLCVMCLHSVVVVVVDLCSGFCCV